MDGGRWMTGGSCFGWLSMPVGFGSRPCAARLLLCRPGGRSRTAAEPPPTPCSARTRARPSGRVAPSPASALATPALGFSFSTGVVAAARLPPSCRSGCLLPPSPGSPPILSCSASVADATGAEGAGPRASRGVEDGRPHAHPHNAQLADVSARPRGPPSVSARPRPEGACASSELVMGGLLVGRGASQGEACCAACTNSGWVGESCDGDRGGWAWYRW